MKNILILLIILSLNTYALDKYVKESNLKHSPINILMVGDSITVSNCEKNSNGYCGWRKFLNDLCYHKSNTYGIDTLAKTGISVNSVIKTFPNSYAGVETKFVTQKKYDGVIVALGINDIGDGQKSTKQLKKDYKTLITKIEALNPKQIFLVLPFPYCRYGNSRPKVAERIKEIRDFFNDDLLSNPKIKITLLDIYNDLVEEVNVYGQKFECLHRDIKSKDNLHPKTDDDTQYYIGNALTREIKEDFENQIMCGAAIK